MLPKAIRSLLDAYFDVFAEPKRLPPIRAVQHSINLIPGSPLPNQAPYRMTPLTRVDLERQLTHLIDECKIQPNYSPCGSPVILIPKKDKEWHLCIIDYRELNKIIVKNQYSLPRINDFLDHLKGAKYFTKNDLAYRYHQVWVKAQDTWKIAFKTQNHPYEWLVMPFSLTNAPTTNQ